VQKEKLKHETAAEQNGVSLSLNIEVMCSGRLFSNVGRHGHVANSGRRVDESQWLK